MNKQRRAAIADLIQAIKEAKESLECHRDDEQEYYDNMPEALQGGDKGNNAEEAVSNLEQAISSLEEAVSAAEEVINN
jgi:predicted  nucleic acid-binding Zn-ribbon protein